MATRAYRICSRKHARDLTGEGSRLHGGRWNNRLVPCVYAAESRALALLEYTVNINIDDVPRALCLVTLGVDDASGIPTLSIDDLPGSWRQSPAPSAAKDFGTQLLVGGRYGAFKIPSVIIPKEFNLLINPLVAQNLTLIDVEDFVYDVRIKLK
jgi:RES domain-containing protein